MSDGPSTRAGGPRRARLGQSSLSLGDEWREIALSLLEAPNSRRGETVATRIRWRPSGGEVELELSGWGRTIGANLRPLDRRFDGAWAALHGRLVSWTRMHGHANAQRAQELLGKLFPSCLQFVTSKFESQWFHGRMLLTRIKQDELSDEVNELAGEPFLATVAQVHAEFGKGLGLDENAEADPSVPVLAERLAALTEAIADYCRILSGGVKRKDPDSRARFLAAVAPIDAYRAPYGLTGQLEIPLPRRRLPQPVL